MKTSRTSRNSLECYRRRQKVKFMIKFWRERIMTRREFWRRLVLKLLFEVYSRFSWQSWLTESLTPWLNLHEIYWLDIDCIDTAVQADLTGPRQVLQCVLSPRKTPLTGTFRHIFNTLCFCINPFCSGYYFHSFSPDQFSRYNTMFQLPSLFHSLPPSPPPSFFSSFSLLFSLFSILD